MKPEVRKTLQAIEEHVATITASGSMLKFMEDATVFDCPSWAMEYRTQANTCGLINGILHSAGAIYDLVDQVAEQADADRGHPPRSVGAGQG